MTRRPLRNPLNVEGVRCSTSGASEDDDFRGNRRRPEAGKWKGLRSGARDQARRAAEKGLEIESISKKLD